MKNPIKLDGSEAQKNIINFWEKGTQDLLIDAIAGSGKTTLLMYLIGICDKRVLYLAFNKSIQTETTLKLEKYNFKMGLAKTLHSLGLMALQKSKWIDIKNNIKWELIKKLQSRNKSTFRGLSWKEKSALSFTILDLHDISRLYLNNDLEKLKKVLLDMDKIPSKHPELGYLWLDFIKIRKEHYEQKTIVIDFTDMLYLPVYFNLRIPINPYYLFVDEVQDLSVVQHKLVENLINQGDVQRTVFCGDKRQMIYGFSGAYSSSIKKLEMRDNTKIFPLNICYRCPTSVIEEANEVYDVMIPNKTEKGIVDEVKLVREIKNNSLVIARNTEPLIDLYLQLLSLDKPCVLKGEDILNSITNFLKPYQYETPYIVKKELRYSLEDLKEKVEKDKSEENLKKLYVLRSNIKIFNKLMLIFDDETGELKHLIERLKSLFVHKDNCITLSTIHKSKGLEADIVYILDEKKTIPSRFAKSKQQLEQEENLRYVAKTRAKKEMYYLNLKQ